MMPIQTPSKTLEHRVKTWLTPVRKRIVMAMMKKAYPVKIPLLERLKAWRLGYSTTTYKLLDLENNNPKYYLRDLSDINYIMNYPGANAVNDKYNLARLMPCLAIPTPEALGLINLGKMIFPSHNEIPDTQSLSHFLDQLLATRKKLVLRPTFSGAGIGVFFLELRENGILMNGRLITLNDVVEFLCRQEYYLITQFMEQADYAKAIFPDVTNTVRILSIWDSETNSPIITNAAHRIGTRRSYPLDAFRRGAGGLSASVDLSTGTLGKAVGLTDDGNIRHHRVHPETRAEIEGVIIPHWERLKTAAIDASKLFAASPYIGWDIMVTNTGPLIIEGNSPPGTSVWQVHAPLLKNPCLKRFYQEHGMLRSS